ncbi:hypothetical protein FJZ17_02470 [Candidatus Pacearchaeota archaeon]|nr:hypothetical protein [Candidatus Pacearchaeota archaeon]
MNSKELIINILGVIFLIIGISDIIYSSLFVSPNLLLWFCHISLVLIGVACFLKKGYLIGAQICILTIPSLFWNFDYLYRLIMHKELFGFTNYMFEGAINLGRVLSFQHFLTVPLALLALYFIKSKRIDFWKLASLELVIVYFLTLLFTNPSYNVNWVFKDEFGFGLEFGILYFFVWCLLFFLITLTTNSLLYILKIFKKAST